MLLSLYRNCTQQNIILQIQIPIILLVPAASPVPVPGGLLVQVAQVDLQGLRQNGARQHQDGADENAAAHFTVCLDSFSSQSKLRPKTMNFSLSINLFRPDGGEHRIRIALCFLTPVSWDTFLLV